MHSKRKGPRVNKYILSTDIRLIDSKGVMVGIISTKQALQTAQSENLDLVEVNPNSEPPVCKILDYGKIRYDKQKQVHKARKRQNVTIIKEIKIRPGIGENDYLVKLKLITSFIEDKYRVKISLRFRGREMIYQDNGMAILNRIIKDTIEIANIESKAVKSNNLLTMVLSTK